MPPANSGGKVSLDGKKRVEKLGALTRLREAGLEEEKKKLFLNEAALSTEVFFSF